MTDNIPVAEEVDYFLPDDYVEEPAETETEVEQVEEQVETTEEVTEVETTVEQEPFDWSTLPLKHLKEQKTLKDFTPEEATEMLQMGMDYKRVTGQRDELRTNYEQLQNDPLMSFGKELVEMAKLSGYEPKQYVEAIRNQFFEQTAQNNGTTADFERMQYEQGVKSEQLKQREAEINKTIETQQSESQKAESYDRFLNNFPEFKNPDSVSKISQETWDRVNNGMDLTQAYTLQVASEKDSVIAQLQQQLKQKEQNTKNIQSAVVKPVGSSGGDETASDEFLEGFLD